MDRKELCSGPQLVRMNSWLLVLVLVLDIICLALSV